MRAAVDSSRSRRLAIPAWLLAAAVVAVGGKALAETNGQAAQTEQQTMSLLQLFMAGGWFMIPIVICSLIGVAIIVERLVSLRRSRLIPPKFMEGLREVLGSRHGATARRAAALEHCRGQDNPVARVIAAGLAKMPRGEEAVEQAIEDVGANEVTKLRRNLRLLFGVSAVAPLLGLLGTVSGMIAAFQVTASMAATERALALAKGIYEALVTTYAGLLVAVPVLIAYYYFQGKIERIVGEMNDISIEFVEQYVSEEPEQDDVVMPEQATASA